MLLLKTEENMNARANFVIDAVERQATFITGNRFWPRISVIIGVDIIDRKEDPPFGKRIHAFSINLHCPFFQHERVYWGYSHFGKLNSLNSNIFNRIFIAGIANLFFYDVIAKILTNEMSKSASILIVQKP